MQQGLTPPFIGIRIKSFSEEWAARGARTLELFIDALLKTTGGVLPNNFVITLPKVTIPEQPRTLVRLFELLERKHGLAPGKLRLELMVELTQALIGPDGRCPLPDLVAACEGRCFGAHLGTYDFTASCNLTAAYQTMRHPWCDLAKGMMVLALGGTGLFLSDGATNVMPTGPHRGDSLGAAVGRRVVLGHGPPFLSTVGWHADRSSATWLDPCHLSSRGQ
jgi:citrate lyase beta subunit